MENIPTLSPQIPVMEGLVQRPGIQPRPDNMQARPLGMPPRPPGLPPRPPMMPRPPGMPPRLPNMPLPPVGLPRLPTPMRPSGAPPDLGPPNGELADIRNPNLQPPALRPTGPTFSSGATFSSNKPPANNFQPHFSQMQNRKPAPSANTTLPKPPIFDKDGQPWLEACSASGKIYFFNARTRETRWSKPETFEEAEKKKAKTKTVEEIVEETKAELLAEDEAAASDDEMKLSGNEMQDEKISVGKEGNSGDEKVASLDIEMKPSPIIEMAPIELMEKREVETTSEEIVQSGHAQQEASLKENTDTAKHEIEESYSPNLSETGDSPLRPLPLDVDQLPPVIITKKISYEDEEDEQKDFEDEGEEEKRRQKRKQKKIDRVEKENDEDQHSVLVETGKPNSLVALSQQHTSSSEDESSGEEVGMSRKKIKKKDKRSRKAGSDDSQKNEDKIVKDNEHLPKGSAILSSSDIDGKQAQSVPPPTHQFAPPGMPPNLPPFGMPPHLMRPPPCIPPPGFPGFPPRIPHGFLGGPSRFPPFPGFRMPPPDFVPKTIGDWTEHRLPDGRLYYYNNRSKESKWDKPAEFGEVPIEEESNEVEVNKDKKKEILSKEKEPVKEKGKKAKPVIQVKEEEKIEENNASKPVASRPIVGTGWHLVWTGDGKVFFFNPTSKTSIWERPKELVDNDTVDDIINQGPKEKGKEVAQKEPEKVSDKENEVGSKQIIGVAGVVEKLGREASMEPEIKKKKVEPEEGSLGVLPIISNDNTHKIDSRHETMKEIEVRKAIIPLDERMTMFTNLLKEKEVSAFSTWEKELHKILFDPRYLLLTMKERKQCFEKYVKVRAVEERKERIQKLRERKEDFKKLLEEVVSSARMTFSDFANKNSKDMRFKAIEKMKDREALYNDFMIDFRKHEKERLKVRDEKLKAHFFELLSELSELHEASQWKKVRLSIESDRRYELVGSSAKREQFFHEYIQQLEAKRAATDTGPPSPAPPPPTEEEEEIERPPSPEGDPESIERNERINASIRKREEEVRAQKEVYEKDREKEREMHQYDKAVQHFRALLADMVKDSQFTWKETRRSLRKDPRWVAVEMLDKNEKEDLFDEHINEIKDRKKKSFRKLLDESDIPLDAEWRDIRRKVKEDPRYLKFGATESREEEFDAYMKEKTTIARAEFRDLLQECKLITYKSKKLAEENPNHIKDINATLKKDKRYLTMSALASERDRLLSSHLDDLHKRGPPPPPTATNPGARYAKKE